MKPLGTCRGARPWLGRNAAEDCKLPSRLLIRTAANAYFPQVVSVLSIPDRANEMQTAVSDLWDDLQIVEDAAELAFLKKKPKIAERLAEFDNTEILEAIREAKSGGASDRPVKQEELDAILAAPEGYGEDVPVDPDFHARRLPEHAWRRAKLSDGIETVIQLHRLREVLALTGFTRFEAVTPDIHGEYESDVERAELALEPSWVPGGRESRGGAVSPAPSQRGSGLAWAPCCQDAPGSAGERPSELARQPEEQTPFPGRALPAPAHALAPPDPVSCDALRLSGEFDPRANLRGRGRRALRHLALHGQPRRGGNPRGARPAGPPHRDAPEPGASGGCAVLERSDLRRAPARREHGESLAPRRRLSRLRARCGTLV